MEYALLELITHEEMRCILKKRHLDEKNIDKLSPLELECVYRRFALPRSRRNNRRTNAAATDSATPCPNIRVHLEDQAMPLVTLDASMCAMNVDVEPMEYVENVMCPANMDQCEKRQLDKDVWCGTDNYLSSVTKRIKIDWS